MEKKTLLEKEVSRCNRNLFIFNIGLTLLALGVISWFFSDFETLGKIILVIVLLAFPGYNYYKLYRRLENPNNHPDYKSILRLGDHSEVSKHIEEDLSKNLLFPEKSNNKFYQTNKLMITPNWIIIRGFFHFYIIHATELVWVYIKQTKHSVNFIPTGSTYSLIFNSNYMKNIEVEIKGEMLGAGKEEESGSVLELVHFVAPWAIYGFSEEIKYVWENNPGNLIQEVNQRFLELQKRIKKHGKRKKK
jgi:hypothetical protein